MKRASALTFFALLIFLNSASRAQTLGTADSLSGMYTFLQEGEFVQLDVEDGNRVGGFVSRYGSGSSDQGAFLDQLFDKGELHGQDIHWTTKPIHGTWFEFKGKLERGEAETPDADGFYVMKGTLTQFDTDDKKKSSGKNRDITMKSFPKDSGITNPKTKD